MLLGAGLQQVQPDELRNPRSQVWRHRLIDPFKLLIGIQYQVASHPAQADTIGKHFKAEIPEIKTGRCQMDSGNQQNDGFGVRLDIHEIGEVHVVDSP